MNRSERRAKVGDVAAVLRGLDGGPIKTAMRRELVAAWCKMALPAAENEITKIPAKSSETSQSMPAVSPRIRETLKHLLTGDSEKQIANKLGISRHTVHVYVKRLYVHYRVSSRGELLAHFVSSRNEGNLTEQNTPSPE